MNTTTKTKELGTLVVVVLKARNLPDKHTFTKQDPFAVVQLGPVKEQTQIDKRGGQHPVWDEDLRVTVLSAETKENRTLKVSCYAKEPKEDDLIGAGEVDITETLTTGEFDDWVKLEMNGAYRGEVYLEMTFFASGPPLARRASKLAPSERLWRPPQTPPKTSAQPLPYNSPPARYADELGPSTRPTHLAPPRASHSQSPTSRTDAPLPPVPEKVPASLLPAPIRASAGKAASTNTSPKKDPAPIPAALRPGGAGGPQRSSANQVQQQQGLRPSSLPTSPTQAQHQLLPAVPGQSHVYGSHSVPDGYVPPATQPAYNSPLNDFNRPRASSPVQPGNTSPRNGYASPPPGSASYESPYQRTRCESDFASHPPMSAPSHPVYSTPRPPVSPAGHPTHPPVSAPSQPLYPPPQNIYSPYPSVAPHPSASPYPINPSYDPPPLSYTSTSPPPATAPAIPAVFPGSLQLSFPEPSMSGPSYPHAGHQMTLPNEFDEERQRRLSTRYGSPMPLPPGVSPHPPPKEHVKKSSSPSPNSKRPAKTDESASPALPVSAPTPQPAPSRTPVPNSYLEKERAALERRRQEEADAEFARKLAAEAENEEDSTATSTNTRAAAGRTEETDEELAKRLARELNSDVLEEVKRGRRDGSSHMPGGW